MYRVDALETWIEKDVSLCRLKAAMTDLTVTLKYSPHHRTNIGLKGTPAVRVYRSDPEGVTLQIRHEHEYMSAWPRLQMHLRLPMLSAKWRKE
jgi:hypothetical protein